MDWNEIPRVPTIHYACDVPLGSVEEQVNRYVEESKLQLCPDFQRGHVWTRKQRIAYIEFVLTCPDSGRNIYFNHPGWMDSFKGEFVLVDGLQRITSILMFVRNELPAYGHLKKDFTGVFPWSNYTLRFCIAKLSTRADVLKWYIAFNAGGTPHSKEEITRVKKLLRKEIK